MERTTALRQRVSAFRAMIAWNALKDSELAPFEGAVARGAEVEANVDTDPRVKTWVEGTGENREVCFVCSGGGRIDVSAIALRAGLEMAAKVPELPSRARIDAGNFYIWGGKAWLALRDHNRTENTDPATQPALFRQCANPWRA